LGVDGAGGDVTVCIARAKAATFAPIELNDLKEDTQVRKLGRTPLLSAALVAALAVAACGSAEDEPADTTEAEPSATTTEGGAPEATEPMPEPSATAITLWHSWKDLEIESLNEVLAGFNAMYPDVTIETLFIPHEDIQNKATTELGAGEGPDILIDASDRGPSYLEANLIYDMSDLISPEVVDGLVDSAVDAVTYDGVLVGLPQTLKGVVMFRNKALMADPPASLDDIIDAGDASLERGYFFAMAHLSEACGGMIANADGTAAFNTPEGVCWLELIDSFPGVAGEYNNDNDVDTFKQGMTSVIIDGTWNASGLADAIGPENLAIDPWPTTESGALSGVVQTESIYIGANTFDDKLAASAAFVEYFLSPEAQAILANPDKAGHIPAVDGLQVEGDIQAQALAAFQSGGVAQPRHGGCYWANMDTALQAYFGGSSSAEDALAEAAETINSAVEAGECP